MEVFAKLFDTKYGQVVVMLEADDEGDPAIHFYARPEGIGTCRVGISFEDSDDGYDAQERAFQSITIEQAENAVERLFSFDLKALVEEG